MNEWDWNAVGTHVNFYKGERVLSVTEAAEELNTLERELAAANAKIEKAMALINKQAEDDGLWFLTTTASEAYLQQSLRLLTDAVEGLSDDAN